ncbi:hypothetical protein ACI2KR_08360 [Pseudomonas luteola]
MSNAGLMKQLLMGNLEILDRDDPTILKEFLNSFQGLSIKDSSALYMVFIRSCNYNAVNIVSHILENELITDLNAYDSAALKAAIKADSHLLLESLIKYGIRHEEADYSALMESARQGALKSFTLLASLPAEEGAESIRHDRIEKATVELVKNSFRKDPESIVEVLKALKNLGHSLSGTNENLLMTSILAYKDTDMSPVISFLLEQKPSTASLRSARSALHTVMNQITYSRSNNQDPHTYFRKLRSMLEGYTHELNNESRIA